MLYQWRNKASKIHRLRFQTSLDAYLTSNVCCIVSASANHRELEGRTINGIIYLTAYTSSYLANNVLMLTNPGRQRALRVRERLQGRRFAALS